MMKLTRIHLATAVFALALINSAAAGEQQYVFESGHTSLQGWLLPDAPPFPEGNEPTAARVNLGKKLFFDPRLSGDGNMACATCHNPMFGWSDGLSTARGSKSQVLGRASPTVVNTAYNTIQMWDGRKKSLEDQAMGPMMADVEMNTDLDKMFAWLNGNEEYRALFAEAYRNRPIDADTVSMAIASFERTIISNDSPFDQWVKGDATSMTPQQVRGFELFIGKANCATCHSGPNFSDDGFHNVGLASWGSENPDMGRYAEVPLGVMKGAFKTPTIRDITLTAPYFHDGSAATLMDVVNHYAEGGEVTTNLSPNMKEVEISEQDKQDLVAFMEALTTSHDNVVLPKLALQ